MHGGSKAEAPLEGTDQNREGEGELLRAAVSYAPEITRFLERQIPAADDAEDLLQELYVAVLKMPRAPMIRHPKAYLFAIAANLVHQHWQRSKTRPPHVPLEDVPVEILESLHSAFGASTPESAVALAECVTALRERLSELSPKVQAAVVWHHRDGYTCDEIAEKLSVVRHRVKKYLVRGLTHCRSAPGALEFA
jgi:RNA polymerase sigma-70 factor (ECF subfamily)